MSEEQKDPHESEWIKYSELYKMEFEKTGNMIFKRRHEACERLLNQI